MKKTAVVVGLGISGVGASLLLRKKGWKVKVTEEIDSPQVRAKIASFGKVASEMEFEIGKHTRDFIKGADLVVTSPGVRDESGPLKWAKEMKIPVIDEIELGYRFCPARIVAVTGTNGKSTTVTLIGKILKAAGYDAVVCGNIGSSFAEKTLSLKKDSVVVLELSSFQLQRIDTFRPYVSVFLNLTQNHYDRHKDLKEYINAKMNIFMNQKMGDWAILNYEDKNFKQVKKRIKSRVLYFGNPPTKDSAYLNDGTICINVKGKPKRVVSTDDLMLQGQHNLKNAMAAILVGLIFKADIETMRDVLKSFRGLEHRCEFVEKFGGVRFINDSKSTTVDSAICAINAINRPVILIAGGRDKGSDFTLLRSIAENKLKAIVLIGESREKIKTQLLGTTLMHEADDLSDAVNLSFNAAEKGDVVLLSPMCASFDMFKNFEHRGEIFKEAVILLKEKCSAPELCKTR